MKGLAIGGAMLDTIAIIESDRIERMTMFNAESSFLLLEEGSKTEAIEISTHVGGGAVNAAVAMARLGIEMSILVKLGNDQRATSVLTHLSQEGISLHLVRHDEKMPTGASVLVSSHDRNAAIFTFRGANTLLAAADAPTDAFDQNIVYVSSLSNEAADAFPDFVQRAKAQGALVAANPRVRQLSSRGNAFQDTLKRLDILAINRVEAGTLVPLLAASFGAKGPPTSLHTGEKPPRLFTIGLSGGGHDMSLAPFCKAITRLGPRFVVITDGRHGAYLATPSKILYCTAIEANVVGTAGAGDAFNATFVAAIALGRSPDHALRMASANAAAVVGYADTQTGLLSIASIESRLSELSLDVRSWDY